MDLLNEYDTFHSTNPGRNLPLDLFMRYHFLKHKNEFDDDARSQIVDNVYTMQRYKGYLNAIASRKSSFSPNEINWAARFRAFQSPDFPDLFDSPSIPLHARCSTPKDLLDLISKSHGPDQAFEICRTTLERPLLTIRANTIKTNR